MVHANLEHIRHTPNNKSARKRIAAYPDEIAKRRIRMFSVKGDTVLDPFLGSGTTVKAAMQNDRNSAGYETDAMLLPLIKNVPQ
jgi:DNA modification methylase